jgi:hypothetical protein
MNLQPFNDWGWRSPPCLAGIVGAVLAAFGRLMQEGAGTDVQFMPLFDSLPGWFVADVTVIVSAVVGGVLGQIGCALAIWLKQEL